MFKSSLRSIRTIAILLVTAFILAPTGIRAELEIMPGQTVVKVNAPGQLGMLVRKYDAVVIDSIENAATYLIQLPEGKDEDSLISGLNRNPAVESAHGNFLVNLPETFQISQGFPDQRQPVYAFAESPLDYYSQPGTYDTGIDSAQTLVTGEGVIVAVIDNGIVYDHPIMADLQTVTGRDLLDNDPDPSETMDGLYNGHGTFVSSLVWLTAPDSRIMPLRAFDADGRADVFSLIQAVYWAVSHGADVINMSCGTGVNSPILRAAIQNALSSGVIVVAAAGNTGDNTQNYPAAFEGVIAVTAIDQGEYLAEFASYGTFVDLVAPGVNVYGALPGETDWGTWTGTSFSSPLVAGTAALMKEIDPTLSPGRAQDHLCQTARIDLAWGEINPPDSEYGFGALNALAAVISLTAGDMDLSGNRDIVDLQILMDYVSGNPAHACDCVYDMLADVNCDSLVDIQDAEKLASYFSGQRCKWEPCFR